MDSDEENSIIKDILNEHPTACKMVCWKSRKLQGFIHEFSRLLIILTDNNMLGNYILVVLLFSIAYNIMFWV